MDFFVRLFKGSNINNFINDVDISVDILPTLLIFVLIENDVNTLF